MNHHLVDRALGLFNESLHATQGLVLNSWADEILYGGAKGGGKSFLLRFCFCMWCLKAPGLQAYLFRRTHEDLWKNHMEGSSSFPLMLAGLVNEGFCDIVGREVRWWNGARIFLNHMQLVKHALKYQGIAIHLLGIDELTQFEEAQYRYLLGSVRLGDWKPPVEHVDRFPLIICGANPGGVSHDFVKSRFIDQGPYVIQHRTEPGEGGTFRQFIPARAEDNPELLKHDPNYLSRVEAMGNPELVRAMREGDWEIVIGSMFGYIWRNPRHVLQRPFAIPATWPIWRGGDDGFASPAAIYWVAENPDTDSLYVIGEIYEARLLPGQLAERTLAKDAAIPIDYGDEVALNDAEVYGIMDSASFADTGTGQKSRGSQMNELGTNWRPVEKPKNSRVMRVQAMHQALAPNPKERLLPDGTYPPMLRFFPSCTEAVRTIPKLPISNLNPEDIDTKSDDHAFDALTYALTRVKRFFAKVRVAGI